MTSLNQDFIRSFDDPKLEALLETMFMAAYADGEFSDEERSHFAKSVESLTDGRVTGPKFDELMDRVVRDYMAGERSARLASIKSRLADPGACKVALALAVELMAADGIVRTSERELILEIAEALDIDADAAADLVAKLTRSAQ